MMLRFCPARTRRVRSRRVGIVARRRAARCRTGRLLVSSLQVVKAVADHSCGERLATFPARAGAK